MGSGHRPGLPGCREVTDLPAACPVEGVFAGMPTANRALPAEGQRRAASRAFNASRFSTKRAAEVSSSPRNSASSVRVFSPSPDSPSISNTLQ